MAAATTWTTEDGRDQEQRRRAAEFQALLDAEHEHLAEVIELRPALREAS